MRAKVLLATALTGLVGGLVAAAPSANAETSASAFSSRLVTLVNEARAQHGLRSLSVASGTTVVAAGWSSHMASTSTLAHNPSLQSQLESHGSPNWTTYGENVGEGPSSSADKLFTAYMNSPEHKANILGSGYRYIGIATTFSGSVAWNTMDFVDQYGSTAHVTTSAPAPTTHTTTVTHHVTVSKPAVRPAVRHAAPRPAPVVRHKLARHTVAAQHERQSVHVYSQRPHTDVLIAAGRPLTIGAGAPSSEPRLIVSLVAAALVAMTGVSWLSRRRVAA
jgi:hypothetical protein